MYLTLWPAYMQHCLLPFFMAKKLDHYSSREKRPTVKKDDSFLFFEGHRQWKEHHSCICIIYSVCAYICTQCGQMLVFTCTICKSRLFYIPMIDVDIHKWPTYIIYIKQDLLYPDDESAQLPDPAERLEELQTR